MQDIGEAIEKLSMLLAMRIENSVRKRGWPGKPLKEKMEGSFSGRTIYLTSLRVALPLGPSVLFVPEGAPADESWLIRVRRSDGVVRKSWADGVRVKRLGEQFQLTVDGSALNEARLNQILDELAGEGLTGHALMISKAWGARFGPMPPEIFEILAGARDVQQLDHMHEAVLTGLSRGEVETSLGRLAQGPRAS